MKLIINFISKLGVDTVSRLIGFLTLPVITRALGPEGYGLYTYVFVILSYFGFFIDFGYLNYGTNKLCESSNQQNVVGQIISLQILTAFFSYMVLFVAGYFIFDFGKYILLLIFSFTFLTQTISIRYFYLARNKLYYNSISELAGQLVYAALVFTVFISMPSVTTLIVLSLIQASVTGIFLFVPFIRKNNLKIDLHIKTNLKTLKEAYKLGIASKAEGITSSFIILSIGIFLNEHSVGLYNASYKIYLILLTVVQGLSYTMMPMLLQNVKSSGRKNVKRISLIFYLYLIAGLLLFAVTFIFSSKIISVMFGPQFIESADLLKNFSLTILIWPVLMFMGLVILAYNRYNYLLITSLSSTILSIAFSLILINVLGVSGAAIVLTAVAAGTILVSIYFLKRISREENFHLYEIFSVKNAAEEIKFLIQIKSSRHRKQAEFS